MPGAQQTPVTYAYLRFKPVVEAQHAPAAGFLRIRLIVEGASWLEPLGEGLRRRTRWDGRRCTLALLRIERD